jgi:protein-glutamine gamma-glutamyltransferase
MVRKTHLLLAGLLGLLVGHGPRAAADEKPVRLALDAKDIQASLGTEWYGVYIQGKKVGYFTSTRALAGAGASAVYRESSHMHMKLLSLGQKTEMKTTEVTEFDATPPYAMRRDELTDVDGNLTQRYQLVRAGNGFTLTTLAGRDRRTKQVPPIDYTLADSLSDEVWLRRGARPGERIVSRSFDVKELELDLDASRLVATKTSVVNGVPVTYHEVETKSRKSQLTTLARYDTKGRILSGVIAGFIEIRLETEAQAKNTEYSADLFVLGMVKIDQKLGHARNVAELALEAVGKGGSVLAAGPRQTVTSNKAGTYTLKLGKRHGTPTRATAREIADALAETTTYPITDPKVQALARRAVGDAQTPREKVQRLVDFVHAFIEPKLTANGPNLYDLLERRKGDCKSYALLFTTLARAAGIPAREVNGLVYMGDDAKAFGGHAWNEVVLDGLWVPIDATARETEIDATHISFGTDTTATNNMVSAMGRLTFRLIAVERGK